MTLSGSHFYFVIIITVPVCAFVYLFQPVIQLLSCKCAVKLSVRCQECRAVLMPRYENVAD